MPFSCLVPASVGSGWEDLIWPRSPVYAGVFDHTFTLCLFADAFDVITCYVAARRPESFRILAAFLSFFANSVLTTSIRRVKNGRSQSLVSTLRQRIRNPHR